MVKLDENEMMSTLANGCGRWKRAAKRSQREGANVFAAYYIDKWLACKAQ